MSLDTASPPRFSATVSSEWTKLVSVRSTAITAVVAVALSVLATALVCNIVGATWDDWDAADRADFEPTSITFVGLIFGGIALVVLGVRPFASEYSSGMIRLTLTATPRRGRVLLAKTVVVVAATLVVGAVATLGMFLVGQAILGSYGVDTASLRDGDTLRAVVATSALTPVFPVIGLALAAVLRSTAGAITTVLAMIFAPGIVGELVPEWWHDNVLAYAPGAASDAVSVGHLDDELANIHPALALLVMAGWLAAFLAIAYLAFSRRDG